MSVVCLYVCMYVCKDNGDGDTGDKRQREADKEGEEVR